MAVSVRIATPADHEAAVGVWHDANVTRGLPPSPSRIERVVEKLADPDATVLVAVADGRVVGMLQAEPGRTRGGGLIPSLGHVSMVFVVPEQQGAGIGGRLLDALADAAADEGWSRLSLWTRASNRAARRCYQKAGWSQAPESKELPDGSPIDRWARILL